MYGSVEFVEDCGDVKIVMMDSDMFEIKVFVIGIGFEYCKLGVIGEDMYGGCGVLYCVVCDGVFFCNKYVVVVGGGDLVIEEGIYLI